MEVVLLVFDDIRSHTGKGNGQVAREIQRVGIAHTQFLKELREILTLDESTGLSVTLAATQAHGQGVDILLLDVAETLVTQVLTVADDVAPVLGTSQRVQRVGILTDGIETTDNATH